MLGVTATATEPFVIADCVAFSTVAFPCVVGDGAVPLTVELFVEAVEFGLVAFCVEVTLAVVGDEVALTLGVAAVLLIVDVALFTVVAFAELFVTFDVAGDCVALETAVSLEELALPFIQTSDKLPALAISQCLVRFKVVPLQARSGFVLFGEQTSVRFTCIAVPLTCKVAFLFTSLAIDVQFEDVWLHEAVELAAVEFCSEELTLLVVVFSDNTVGVSESKGAAFACEIQTGNSKMAIAITNIVNTYFVSIFARMNSLSLGFHNLLTGFLD